jgi:hypothetical protein
MAQSLRHNQIYFSKKDIYILHFTTIPPKQVYLVSKTNHALEHKRNIGFHPRYHYSSQLGLQIQYQPSKKKKGIKFKNYPTDKKYK